MSTRDLAVHRLLHRASDELGEHRWTIIRGNRLHAKLSDEADGVIFALAARLVSYTVSFAIGPRFPAVERIAAKAGRAAGLPDTHFREAAAFPTVFDRSSSISSIPDNVSLSREQEIVSALRIDAVRFIREISTVSAAANYALSHPLAFGHHSIRIPVMLAKLGRTDEAEDFLDRAVANGPNADFLKRYRNALPAVL